MRRVSGNRLFLTRLDKQGRPTGERIETDALSSVTIGDTTEITVDDGIFGGDPLRSFTMEVTFPDVDRDLIDLFTNITLPNTRRPAPNFQRTVTRHRKMVAQLRADWIRTMTPTFGVWDAALKRKDEYMIDETIRENTDPALMKFIKRLTAFKVQHWGGSSASPSGRDRAEATSLDSAHVVSSLRKDGRHAIVIDIDHPAWLVPSTTPGHSHLYIDVPGGIKRGDYLRLLHHLADLGVIEKGYASASDKRGHSDVRLPWVRKKKDEKPEPSCAVCQLSAPRACHDHRDAQ